MYKEIEIQEEEDTYNYNVLTHYGQQERVFLFSKKKIQKYALTFFLNTYFIVKVKTCGKLYTKQQVLIYFTICDLRRKFLFLFFFFSISISPDKRNYKKRENKTSKKKKKRGKQEKIRLITKLL